MKEEGDLVIRLVPANVALEWVLVPVVAHVDGVHDGVHKGQVAVLAHMGTSQLRSGGAAKKVKYFCYGIDFDDSGVQRISKIRF